MSRAQIRVAALVVALGLTTFGFIDLRTAIAASVAVLAMNTQDLFCLKNFFLAYMVLLFGIGGRHFAEGDTVISGDLLIYVVLFVGSYGVAGRLDRVLPAVRSATHLRPLLPGVMVMLVSIGWGGLLALDISLYGLDGFYGGAALADRIARYGHPDFLNGLLTVFEQGLSILSVAIAVVYVQACAAERRRPSLLLLSVPFVIAPLLLLKRYDFAVGLLFLLVVQQVSWRRAGRRYSLSAALPLISGSLVLALLVSVLVGSLRERAVASPPSAPVSTPTSSEIPNTGSSAPQRTAPPSPEPPLITEERTLGILFSELSPLAAYRDIREHPNDFSLQFGRTILGPLALKIVPRSWFPEKPVSSAAYYNELRTPNAFAAGYALPITLFGDLLLNFGFLGSLLGALLLGVVARRLDDVLTDSATGVGLFLTVYYNFYSLLRTDLANSLSVILLTAGVVIGLRVLLGSLQSLEERDRPRAVVTETSL